LFSWKFLFYFQEGICVIVVQSNCVNNVTAKMQIVPLFLFASRCIMHASNGSLHQKCPLTGLDETKISLKVDRRHSTCFALNLIASTTCTNVVQTAV